MPKRSVFSGSWRLYSKRGWLPPGESGGKAGWAAWACMQGGYRKNHTNGVAAHFSGKTAHAGWRPPPPDGTQRPKHAQIVGENAKWRIATRSGGRHLRTTFSLDAQAAFASSLGPSMVAMSSIAVPLGPEANFDPKRDIKRVNPRA